MPIQELKKDKDHLLIPSSSDYKNVNRWVPGQRNACLPCCEPYKHPILINHFLSITASRLIPFRIET